MLEEHFLPRHPNARLQVLKARQTVKDNNDFIQQLKLENQVILDTDEDGFFIEDSDAETFQPESSGEFDLANIRTTDGFSDFFREIFNV